MSINGQRSRKGLMRMRFKLICGAVAMSKSSAPATDDELKAFESVHKSVRWLTASVNAR